MSGSLLDYFDRWIQERGSAAILRERLALAVDQTRLLEQKLAELQKENAEIKKLVRQPHEAPPTAPSTEDFAYQRGAFFRRRPDGVYDNAVYCPRCHQSTSSFPPGSGQFVCDPCRWFSDFEAHELPSILASLPRS